MRFILLAGILILTGCTKPVTQSSSGQDYIARHTREVNSAISGEKGADMQKLTLEAAAVEPNLRFPAKIGLVKLNQYGAESISPEEADSWIALQEKLGPQVGEIVPLNPMVAEMAASEIKARTKSTSIGDRMNKIRLGAARQHVDLILMYETSSNVSQKTNILSVADITILGGYLLPSRALKSHAIAVATLMDVVQGYPYGTVYATAGDSSLSTSWGNSGKNENLKQEAENKAVSALTEKIAEMFMQLQTDAATAR